MSEAEREMLSYISRNNSTGIRTTIKGLIESFEKKPYGWYLWAILCTFAQLYARGKLEVRKTKSSEILECDALERELRNSSSYGDLYIEPQIEFSGTEIRLLKDFVGEFFNTPAKANEAKGLAKEAEAGLKNLLVSLEKRLVEAAQFPFLCSLEPVVKTLQGFLGKPYEWYLRDFSKSHDALFEMKENIIDPIDKFMKGPQRTIFESAQRILNAQKVNLAYVNESDYSGIRDAIQDASCFRGNRIQQLKEAVETLEKRIKEQVTTEIQNSVANMRSLEARLNGMAEFEKLSSDQKEKVKSEFNSARETISRETLIPVIRDHHRQFTDERYRALLADVARWAAPQTPAKPSSGDSNSKPQGESPKAGTTPITPACEMVSSKTLAVDFDRPWLENETDIDRYLSSYRNVLLKQIRSGRKVQI
jgi:hypothetical protein